MDGKAASIIREKKDIMYLLSNFLKKNKLYMKGVNRKTPVIINIIGDHAIRVFLPVNYKPNAKLSLYSMLGRYIELELNIEKRLNYFSYLAKPISIKISLNRRYYERYSCSNGSLSANNFKLFNNKVVLNPRNVSFSIKNILNGYQRSLLGMYPNVVVDTYSNNGSDKLADIVYRGKKAVFIEDLDNIDSYFSCEASVLNQLSSLDEKEFHSINSSLRREKIKSVLVYPLIVSLSKDVKENIAYIKIALDGDFDLPSIIAHLNVVSYEIISKIRREIMHEHFIEQRVLDLSMGGVRLYIDDSEINNYLDRSVELSFSLNFKDKLRGDLFLPFYGNLVYKDSINGASYVGLAFTGGDPKGFDRLESLLSLFYKRQELVKL